MSGFPAGTASVDGSSVSVDSAVLVAATLADLSALATGVAVLDAALFGALDADSTLVLATIELVR